MAEGLYRSRAARQDKASGQVLRNGSGLSQPKRVAETPCRNGRHIAQLGSAVTILQPNSFHQNVLSFANTIKAQGVFYWPLKNAAQSTVDIRDISAVAAKVFTNSVHEGKTYVITGPEALTFQQVAEKLSSVLARKIQYVDVPISAAADGMRKSGMPDWNVQAVSDLLAYFATGAAATVTDTVARLLGRPATSFEQFVKDHRAAFMNW